MIKEGHSLIHYFSAWFRLVKDHFALFVCEAKLAKLTVWSYLISFVLLIMFLMGCWFALVIIAAYALYVWTGSIWIALVTAWLLNVIAMGVMVWVNNFFYKRLTFEKTRQYLKVYKRLKLEHENEDQQNPGH